MNNFDFEHRRGHPRSHQGQQVRTIMNKDEPWFVLKDVCDVLGLRTDKARERLNSDDVDNHLSKGVIPSRGRPLLMVNESGLYDVILDSRKPQAKQFRRWVTNEVLPSIRKHGVGPQGVPEDRPAT